MQFIAVFNASPTITKIPFCGDDGTKELKRLLDLIEKRPQLFIGNDGIWALKHFIDGYCVCLREHGIDVNLQMQEFDTFVFNKFNLKRSSLSIWSVIDKNTNSNDDAFDLFFSLWHEYTENRNI